MSVRTKRLSSTTAAAKAKKIPRVVVKKAFGATVRVKKA